MTPDEMEKAMQFIIKQQAQFAVDMQGVQTQLGKLTDATLTLTGLMGKVLQAQAKTEERFAKMDERFAKMDERFQALEQKLSQTDDRLNVLINIVERYITGRNGKPEG